PSWSIGGASTDVTLEGTGVVRHATFRVKDIPVLYFPYFLFPAKTDRASGFLFPRLANSNRRGFQYEQPFFWAINKSTDATVAVDLETAARVGAIGEYRYRLSHTTRGNFTVAYYNEQIRGRPSGTVAPNGGQPDTPENRFALSGQHRQPFYGGSQLYLRLFAISDDTFLKEINTFAFSTRRDLQLRSSRFTTSRAGRLRRADLRCRLALPRRARAAASRRRPQPRAGRGERAHGDGVRARLRLPPLRLREASSYDRAGAALPLRAHRGTADLRRAA